MSRSAWQHVLGIAGGLLLALFVGWIIDYPGRVVALYLGVVLAWQTRNLIRFEHWLRLRSILKPPV